MVVAGFFLLLSLAGEGKRALFGGYTPGEGLRLKEIRYTHEDPERGMRWELDAAQVTFSEDRNFMVFTDFLLTLKPEARPVIKVQGKRGEYRRLSGIITLTGDVKAETDDGYRILSDRLVVHERARTVETDLPVTLIGPFFTVDGTGLFVDLPGETLKVLSQVTTRAAGKALGL